MLRCYLRRKQMKTHKKERSEDPIKYAAGREITGRQVVIGGQKFDDSD